MKRKENHSNHRSHTILVGVYDGTVTLEKSLEVSHKTAYIPTLDPAISLLRIYPREMKTCSQKEFVQEFLYKFYL